MNFLYPDVIDTVSADEEAAAWPVENVLDEHLQNPWLATSKDAQLKLTVDDVSSCFALAGTNAVSMTVTIKDSTETSTLWGPETYDLTGILDFYQFFTQTGIQQTTIVVPYTEQYVSHVIILDLAAETGETLEVGAARAGILRGVDSTGWNFQEGLKDYPKTKVDLPSGGQLYEKGNTATTFGLDVFAHRTDTFWVIVRQLAKQIGEEPIFFQVTTLDSPLWTVFSHFAGLPGGDHSTLEYCRLKMDLIEAL